MTFRADASDAVKKMAASKPKSMRRPKRPLQTFFQINISGTEEAFPDARQLAAFVEAYHRLYVILRIATDQSYDAETLLNRGYRLRQRDKLRVRSFRMSSPFHVSLLVLAVPGSVAALRWLAPICLDVYKTIRDNPKVAAEIRKTEAEAYKMLAEGRKADAEAHKTSAETEKLRQELSPVRLEEHALTSGRELLPPEAELSLERAKEVSGEISANLFPDTLPGNLEQRLMEVLPPQARLTLSRALTDMTKSKFVIVKVEVMATQIADDDDVHQSEE
jgi:hypothetical protein